MLRRLTREIKIGGVGIGGQNPISVQSMTNTKTTDLKATVGQIQALAQAGCEIVRLAVPNLEAAKALAAIKSQVSLPLIADIHFDYRLALAALEAGVDGLRLNPGNIGSDQKVEAVVKAAKARQVPIRIGVNGGSLAKELLQQYGGITPEALVASALRQIELLEKMDYREIKISLKCSDIPLMLQAYNLLSAKVDYPLHIGVTEAGTRFAGTIKSAVGIGALLAQGIGDTLRVSLTDDPVQEVKVGYEILSSLGLRRKGVEIISCPTCGRTEIDLIALANQVEAKLQGLELPLKVAVMGCPVNGPGEAAQADVGIAGGKGRGLVFRKGQVLRTVPEDQLLEALMQEIDLLVKEENK